MERLNTVLMNGLRAAVVVGAISAVACGGEVDRGSAGSVPGSSVPSPGIAPAAPSGGSPVPPGVAAPSVAGAPGGMTPPMAGVGAVPSPGGLPTVEVPSSSGSTPVAPGARQVTYHKDIRPIMESRCVSCHVAGGAGPFPLDDYDKVNNFGGLVVTAVNNRTMPPWLADDTDCTPIIDDQRLTDDQLAMFTEWQAAGFPEGTPDTYVAPAPPQQRELGEPDMVIKAVEPFALQGGYEDYFCLQTDASITEDTWVTAMDMVPDNAEYVHHAIVNIGRTCSALGTVSENIYSYRPGSRTMQFEEGDALLLPAGSNIMIQFHYNTRFAPRGQSVGTDQSAFRIWTLPAGQLPQREVTRMPHHDLFITIPVGAVGHREGGTSSMGREYTRPGAEIIGISPHMHYLGAEFRETLTQGFGSAPVCLINIPAWDQDWQLDYFFEPEHYIPVSAGASVQQECIYNNRPEDQGRDPEGNLFTPQRTTFGEDTRQEMCLGYIWVRTPL